MEVLDFVVGVCLCDDVALALMVSATGFVSDFAMGRCVDEVRCVLMLSSLI